jgi:release factor glutamine methyltransferase
MDIVRNNEPHIALYAKNNGLYFYEKIIENIPFITKDKYLVCFEIGESQSTKIVDLANKTLKDINISVDKDYSGRNRFIFITNIKD